MDEAVRVSGWAGHSPTETSGGITTLADDIRIVVAALVDTLRDRGPHAALGFLNARTRLRFTGIFQVAPPVLRNVQLYDRENPTVRLSGSVTSLDIGYCGVTCATDAPFSTTDARSDPRLRAHPARTTMIAYAGTPIRSATGSPWGTLCHFDMRPRLIPPLELAVLDAAVPIVSEWVREQGIG